MHLSDAPTVIFMIHFNTVMGEKQNAENLMKIMIIILQQNVVSL